ncbi:MAG: deaminase [Oscillatoriales cyanobacterium SM2_2_1]|nr:deaminase [Oscillatoriales cyanobacterium SM2_2_1]
MPYTFEALNFPRGDRPYVIFNGITSLDGIARPLAGVDSLSSVADRMLLRRLRSQVDGVLVGGGTLRADPIRIRTAPELLPERLEHFELPHPLGVAISNSGDLPVDHPFWQSERPVLFLGAAAPLGQVEFWRSRVMVRRFQTIGEVINQLQDEFAVHVLLSEGGARLNRLLLSQGIGDELFLTIAPTLVGEAGDRGLIGSGEGLGRALRPLSVIQQGDHIFLRYRILSAKSIR